EMADRTVTLPQTNADGADSRAFLQSQTDAPSPVRDLLEAAEDEPRDGLVIAIEVVAAGPLNTCRARERVRGACGLAVLLLVRAVEAHDLRLRQIGEVGAHVDLAR